MLNQKTIKPYLYFLFFSLAIISNVMGTDLPLPAQSINELRQQLEQTLKEYHVPGMSLAIVRKEGPEWVTGIGLADIASGRLATSDTLFRIGSVSKSFVALSILQLVEQGKLSLDDPVRKWAPEVWFENRWEVSDPVRIVHLLEHTTGWDNMHFREYAKEDPSMTLLEAFDFDHHSRISRWKPGTIAAYNNSGPAVAAYIVEKVTGQRFEDYVMEHFFKPLGMETVTYFQPSSSKATTLYQKDGLTPYPYWHFIERPSGSISVSAKDMSNYLRFYLNRGQFEGKTILKSTSFDRMESPVSTWAAREGLKYGYGLSNYWEIYDGFVTHGHEGSLPGSLTQLTYFSEFGIGFYFSLNAGNTEAFYKIGKIIRSYITRDLSKPTVPLASKVSKKALEFTGWYEFVSPDDEYIHFLMKLSGITYVHFQEDQCILTSLGGKTRFVPVSETLFRYLPKDQSPEPEASLALISLPGEGMFIQLDQGLTTLQRIPTWFALTEIALTGFVWISLLSILMFAPFWILGFKQRYPKEKRLRVWPLIAALSFGALIGVTLGAMNEPDDLKILGQMSVWSVSIFLLTITFAFASIMSAVTLLGTPRQEIRRWVWVYSLIVTVALLIIASYLAYWGMIGYRTWA